MSRHTLLTAAHHLEAAIPKCVNRVTAGLVNCNIRIVSKKRLKESNQYLGCQGANFNEREAAFYYEQQGYEVIRLEHFALASVGQPGEYARVESEPIAGHLLRLLPAEAYRRLIARSERYVETKSLALNSVMPKDYALAFYPPDFLVVRRRLLKPNEFKFVEVKGPKDSIHFRQANWIVNLKPEDWDFEIFASVHDQVEDTFVECDLPATTEGFAVAYQEAYEEVIGYRLTMEKVKKNQAAKKAHEASLPEPTSAEEIIESMRRRVAEMQEQSERVHEAIKDIPRRKKW